MAMDRDFVPLQVLIWGGIGISALALALQAMDGGLSRSEWIFYPLLLAFMVGLALWSWRKAESWSAPHQGQCPTCGRPFESAPPTPQP